MSCVTQIIKQTWAKDKPWLVVGTGASLERWDASMMLDYNVWTINGALEKTRYADIAAFHDPVIYNEPQKYINGKYKARFILTRTCNQKIYDNTIFVQFKIDPNIGHYTFRTFNSSSFAFELLMNRFDQVYTLGIDGGRALYQGLTEHYIQAEQGTDFNAHNAHMHELKQRTKCQVIRL